MSMRSIEESQKCRHAYLDMAAAAGPLQVMSQGNMCLFPNVQPSLFSRVSRSRVVTGFMEVPVRHKSGGFVQGR